MKVANRQVLKYSLLILTSFLFFTAVAFLAAFSLEHKIIIGSIFYFFASFGGPKFLPDLKPSVLFQVISLPIVLNLVIVHVFRFQSSLISFPSTIFLLIASSAGFLFYKYQNYLLPLVLVLLLSSWHYKGKIMFRNYMSYGNLSGQVSDRIPFTAMYNGNGKIAALSLSKTVILDFWNSKCGYCYELFPFVDSIHKRIDTSRFDVRVVNIPFKNEKKEDNYNLLDRFDYSFKQLFTDNASSMDSFKITGFPTTIVLQENKIIYRGDFKEALKFLDVE